LTAELMRHFEPEIETVTLMPSQGGRFEVTVNGRLLYSKLATMRHPEPGEVTRAMKKYLQDGEK
jgi:selenoprotein W-related protein